MVRSSLHKARFKTIEDNEVILRKSLIMIEFENLSPNPSPSTSYGFSRKDNRLLGIREGRQGETCVRLV